MKGRDRYTAATSSESCVVCEAPRCAGVGGGADGLGGEMSAAVSVNAASICSASTRRTASSAGAPPPSGCEVRM